ncbi:hypothetical protein CI109_101469 [Kwoniella shandongensis]|uniref:Uncharacterized protein n=1 Tax=Kwoniella shandongensis TaxID=1734106 RepID=A0A5M6C6S6_9TREE|nr:uncharacterized protein CI109_001937 [Kwoniella shandongensis]KAA5529512.1 hypothetical protein CI109_001937 [Kwoniella shandongensis]
MSYASLSSTPGLNYNYSLYAVPVGWLIGMVPLWWAIGQAKSESPSSFNNANPQDSWANLKNTKIAPRLRGRIQRAVAANNNTHVNLPLFAASLVAANVAHVPAKVLHIAAAGWLISRVIYTFAYILIEDPKLALFRSLTYFAGVISCLALFVSAAGKYASVPW